MAGKSGCDVQQSVEEHRHMAATEAKSRVGRVGDEGHAREPGWPLVMYRTLELQALPLLDMGDIWLLSFRRPRP